MDDDTDSTDVTGTAGLVDCIWLEEADKSHGYAARVVVGIAIEVSIGTWDIADYSLGAVAPATETELWATGLDVVAGWPS